MVTTRPKLGCYRYIVWLKTFSYFYLKVNANFVTGLGSWLGLAIVTAAEAII
jgi:hypothetical protein